MATEDGSAAPGEAERYAAAWRSLRTRRWTLGMLVLACLPVVGLVRLFPEGPIQVSVAGTWMALLASSMLWMAAFRCPRCGRFFWWTWTRRNPFTPKCLRCGTPVGAGPAQTST